LKRKKGESQEKEKKKRDERPLSHFRIVALSSSPLPQKPQISLGGGEENNGKERKKKGRATRHCVPLDCRFPARLSIL